MNTKFSLYLRGALGSFASLEMFFVPEEIFLETHYAIQGRRKVWKSGGLVVLGGDNVPPRLR